ncbi:Trm112 family protein [Gemmatimonadota bacterium]
MIHAKLLELLVCPETGQTLRLAESEIVDRVNRAVDAGELRNQGGNRVKNRIGEGLVREDGKVFYPVWDDIPVMLTDEAIRLDSLR